MSEQINTFNSLFFLQPIDQQYSKKDITNVDSMIDLLNISTDSETDDVVTRKPILMKDLLKTNIMYKIKLTNHLKTEWKLNMYIHRLKNYRKYSIIVNRMNFPGSLRML